MALIKCDECGSEMSNTAKRCPKCGKTRFVIKDIFLTILILGVLLAIVGLIFLFNFL